MKSNKKVKIPGVLKLPPMAVVSLTVIYPLFRLLDKWLSSSYVTDSKIDCHLFPAELVGSIFLAEVIIMYIWIALLPKVNSVVFLMLYGAFGMFSIGSYFFLVTHIILFCPPITPQIYDHYQIFLSTILFFSVIIFIFHIRPRTLKAIERNKKKINFNEMVFSISEPPIHISSKMSSKSISVLAISAALISLGLARLIGEWLGDDYKLGVLLVIMMFLSYMMLGYLLLIQLYSAFVVYKRTKTAGRKMTIKEFNI